MRRFLLLALVPLAACGHSDGNAASSSGGGGNRTFAATGFTSVEATGPDDVDVRVGPAFSVRAEGDPKILDKLEIVANGDTLEVRRKSNGFSWGGSDRHAKVFVTLPKLTAVSATGSGDMTIDKVQGDSFKASATGAGDINVGSLAVGTIDLSVTGSGSITGAGTAKSGTLSVTGSGDITAAKLTLSGADVSVMGSGNVEAAVNGAAKVDVMGSGDVTLTGGAKCTTSKMGSGDVSCS